MILAVIADAEKKQVTDEVVRVWLRRLRDVVYDADDLMDEFSYETMSLRRRDGFKYMVRDFVSSFNPLAFRFKLSRKIKRINSKLDQITKDMDIFQLKIIPSSTIVLGESSERRSRQTTSFASQSEIVGREDDKDKLIKILTDFTALSLASLSNDGHHLEKVPVVSIVGMGGLGKTTLAQLVYNDDSVKKYFNPRIWVCVSDNFDIYRLLSDIMESITPEKCCHLSNFNVLVSKVREQLAGKRYLLVLDDLWNEDAEQWERLQSSLIVGAQGCKILTTTRKRQVADVMMGSISPYFLEKLRVDECWSIMERKAISPGGAVRTPNLTRIGKQIANKCSGLPLAAKILGSLMHSKNKESNWLSIREDELWNIPESQSKIIPILKLSYDNLSPHLQRCFSYCSIFPKDLELSKQTLIQLWRGEGFLQPSNEGNDCSLEDIGDEYFDSLIRSSFFDGVEKNELDDVVTFRMHDLVHDLARAVTGNLECSTSKVTELQKISEVRRLNLIMDKELSGSFPKTINNINKLRTIIVLEPKYSLNLHRFSSNKHLRILHLGRPADNFEITYSTSKLRQLRYYHVSSLYLRSNYHSISRLYNLQTLALRGCRLVQNIVQELGSLEHLRHLDISFTDIQELPDSVTSLHNLQRLDLNHCQNLTTFPYFVTGLEHLRFLDMSFTPIEQIPDFVTSLYNLRTLDVNTCTKLKTLPENVRNLKNLGIFNFKNCPLLEALPEDFGALCQLRSLDLEGTKISLLPESCTNLYNLENARIFSCEAPENVANWIKLRKFYYNLEAPMGIGRLVWLQELTYRVRVKVMYKPECNDSIEELAKLNFLEVLTIGTLENVEDPIHAERANLRGKQSLRELYLQWSEVEEEWAGDQSCHDLEVLEALQPPSGLRTLGINNFKGRDLPTWMCVSSGVLLNLDSLLIVHCKGIKLLPVAIGQLPRLKYLQLIGMSLDSLHIGGFYSLIELHLIDVFLLEKLCYSYPCLRYLDIIGCKSITELPLFPSLYSLDLEKVDHMLVWSVGRSQTSIRELVLNNIEKLEYFPITILQNNRNLQSLRITECSQFQGFQHYDYAICYSSSIHTFVFNGCPVLKFLPDLRGWTSLRQLSIFGCPQVKKCLSYDLKFLSFLQGLYVDFIQKDEQQGYPSVASDMVNLMNQ